MIRKWKKVPRISTNHRPMEIIQTMIQIAQGMEMGDSATDSETLSGASASSQLPMTGLPNHF